GAVLYVESIEALRAHDVPAVFASFLDRLAGQGGITVLGSTQPWPAVSSSAGPLGVVSVDLDVRRFDARRECLERALAAEGLAAGPARADALADRSRLTSDQMAEAARTAAQRAAPVEAADVFAAARGVSSRDLARLARRIEPRRTWDDIVLPEDTRSQLRE